MKKQVCLITGSTLGGAEYLAEHLQEVLEKQQISVSLFHGPKLIEIEKEKTLLIVTSTHGAGELPDNLKPLFDEISLSDKIFSDLHFAVIGLGNSDYDTFCNAVNIVEEILLSKSAVKICDALKIDVLEVDDQEQYAENWLPSFIQKI